MPVIDFLILKMVQAVNQKWFTEAVIEIIENNNNQLRPNKPIQPTQ